MNTINYNELNVGNAVGTGNWSTVYECDFYNQKFCAKLFDTYIPKEIIDNIISLTSIEFEKEYFTPLYVIESGNHVVGYLTNYNSELEKLKFDKYNDSLVMLKNARNLLDNFHKKYNRFHGDISLDNMLFDKKLKKAYLIDFDASLNENEELKSIKFFRIFIKDFLKYYKPDRNMDIYSFNLLTLKYLYNYAYYDELFKDILNDNFFDNINNSDVKRLSKELLLINPKRQYSGEYIIDYI